MTRFLNVDLELVATIELDPLLDHLQPATITLRDSVDDERRTVWLELSTDPQDTDDAIRRFAALVESLPGDLRGYWDRCEDRCLNVGIQSGFAPHASAFRISVESIAKLASMAARIEITVYRPDAEGAERELPKAT
jgi:hypothetical protein